MKFNLLYVAANQHPVTRERRWTMTTVRKEILLKSKDVAHILDLPPDDVIYLARKGKLRGVKEGKYWKFKLRDVKYFQRKKDKD